MERERKNQRRIDNIARTLGRATGRRQVLVAAGSALVTVIHGRIPVAAGCKKVGKKCDKNKDCCAGSRCKGDTKDKKGKCRCKGGFTPCNKQCCSAGEECVGGACVTPPGGCPPGADSCGSGFDVFCAGRVGCECSRSTEGQTLCGQVATTGAACGQCDSSADCASFGPGAFCVVTGSVNCCGPGSQNVCRLPCET